MDPLAAAQDLDGRQILTNTKGGTEMQPNRETVMGMARRRFLGVLMVSSGAVLTGCGFQSAGAKASGRGKVLLKGMSDMPKGLEEAISFPLLEAIYGRRSRRFFMGAEIPDGVMAYKSSEAPMPLSDLEQMMVLTAVGGNTGWNHLIFRHKKYAPYLSNYSMAAGGRTFPSAAGFHTSQLFYTDDNGTYFMSTRDAPSLVANDDEGNFDLNAWLEAHKRRIRKLSDTRLYIPAEEPYMEGHNTWVANGPGTTLVWPVADLAQHHLGILAFLVQNGFCVFDDFNNRKIPGMEKFRNLVDVENPYPLSYMDRYALAEATVELSTSCYAGALTLQALGLGGWMYDGIDPFTVLGASGNPEVPGLGFRYDTDDRWALPNVTGLAGVFEAFCPPHYPDMRTAVEALADRKFSAGGPFNQDTPGPFKDTPKVRTAAQVHGDEFKDCVAHMAQYVYDTFGKYPASVPSVFHIMYLQAHHLDLKFYDHHFGPGAYLDTHRRHMDLWHGGEKV